ncbi:transmembrane protein 131-like isoform X2 [Lytechinus variegatus]|uniref:transmembrane protein 131-like isoform X2 n=1 Tax=Lytechinus variegatus TaxID=7654 RepID=UPI001BB10020|nr:transmembrane protein 131-like isoform X2 [Lytechinus variegatus]
MAGTWRMEKSSGFIQMWFTLFLGVLQVIPTYIDTAKAQTEAFVQSDISELRQLVEEVALKSDLTSQTFTIGENGASKNQHMGIQWNSALRFEPAMLDFGEHAVGMPEIRTVRVFNPHHENMLRMLSISGTTPHFHCSFFQEKVLPPDGNTTFDVVFLARLPGNVENTIFIRTSAGTTPYQVFGTGVPNPYRLRPFLGARVPLNSSFSPLIKMHNPFSSGLMVTEMYSSGGDLHLELPSGSQEAPRNQWEIAPYQTKSVMRASFVGRTENNHTAFIRIRTNRTTHKQGPLEAEEGEFLMLPVEVEVSSVPGIYSSLEMMDFGTLRTQDEPKTIPLYLLNTGPKVVHISSVSLVRANQAISIDFSPLGLRPSDTHIRVANVTFHPRRANHTRLWSGKIIIKTKEKGFKLLIPYQAHVLQGILRYSRNNTLFYLSDPPPKDTAERNLSLTNLFNFSIVLHSMKLVDDAKEVFSVMNVSLPVSITPQETYSDLVLRFNPANASQPVSATLKLNTNASVFTVPIYAYTGKLKFAVSSDKDKVDFGTMSVTDTRTTTIEVVNNNPVEVPLEMFSCTLEKCFMLLRSIERIDDSNMDGSEDTVIPSPKAVVIPAGHVANFVVTVTAPLTEGQFVGEVIFKTAYEEKRIMATLKTVEGYLSVRPDYITMKPSFPGYTQSQSITVSNSFSHRLRIESIAPDPPDDRFYYKPPVKVTSVEVDAHKKQKIGRIVFDSRKQCATDCYVGLPPNSQQSEMWLSSLALPEETQDIDKLSYNYLRNKWYKMVESGQTSVNTTMYLNSNLVKQIPITVQAELEWPTLADKQEARFPLTYIGNTSIAEVTLLNPTDRLVVAQLLPISAYQDPGGALDLLTESEQMDPEFIEIDDPGVFFLADVKDKSSPGKCLKSHRESVENMIGVKTSDDALLVGIKPRQNVTVHLGFRPTDTRERYSLILIRNNLTVLDAVVVQGQGGSGELRLNNKRPGVNSNLLFELKSSHLVDCNKTSPKARSPPNFTVKRTFNMKNTGQLPLSIDTFLINGRLCEGYGFRVLQCRPVEILPNETRRLDIAFTPDFTLNRVTRELEVVAFTGETLSFTLIATLPPNMLAPCTAALPRPHWEIPLHLLSVCLMALLFLVIVAVSYLEMVRYLEPSVTTKAKLSEADQDEIDSIKPFDLRNIAGLKPLPRDRGGSVGLQGNGGGAGAGGGGGANTTATNKTKSRATSLLSSLGEKLNIFSGSRSGSKSRSASNSVANNTRQAESRGSIDREKIQVNNLSSTTASSAPKVINRASSGQPAYSLQDRKGSRSKRGILPDYENNLESASGGKNSDYSNGRVLSSEMIDENHVNHAGDYESSYQLHNSRMRGKVGGRGDDTERQDIKDDDISSTTTEESNAESEYSERSSKQYVDDDASLSESGVSNIPADDLEAEGQRLAAQRFKNVKSKGKTRKGSSKGNSKSNFHGDVCRPSTLELPYTTALEAGRRQDNFDKEPTSPHSIAAKVAAKATKKTIKVPKTSKPMDSDATSTTSSEPDKDSPLPLWDQAKPIPSGPGHQRPTAQTQQPIGSSSRPNSAGLIARPTSYSSAVSGAAQGEGSKGSKGSSKSKLTKQLSAPEEKSAFSTVNDKKNTHPGTIGTKQSKSSKPRSAGATVKQPPSWSQTGQVEASGSSSDTSSSAGPASPSFFGSSANKLDQGSGLGKKNKKIPTSSQFNFVGDALGAASMWDNPTSSPLSAPPGLPPPTSSQGSGGLGDWLGFGVSRAPTSSSMWESSPSTSNTATWSTNTSSPGFSQQNFYQSPGLWSSPSPLGGGENTWSGGSTSLFDNSIWSSSSDNNSSLLDTSGPHNATDPEATPRAFDPFRSSIWGPSHGSGGPNPWANPDMDNNK